jgi:predicted TIM-barrel fold metal-dependent hydrolase
VLEEFISEDFLSADEAWQAAEAILGENARELYRL